MKNLQTKDGYNLAPLTIASPAAQGLQSTTRLPTTVINRSTTTVTFDNDAEYNPISSGTFTVNDSTKITGVVVCVYLTPSATAPFIPSTGYQSNDAYVGGKNLMYTFKVGANNKIQYTITLLD